MCEDSSVVCTIVSPSNALHVKGGKGGANELVSLLCAGTHRFSPEERLSFMKPITVGE